MNNNDKVNDSKTEKELSQDKGRIQDRIDMLGAMIWAQEHHNQIMYMVDSAEDDRQLRCELMQQYNFTYDQAMAISDMRVKAFSLKARENMQEELESLFRKIE